MKIGYVLATIYLYLPGALAQNLSNLALFNRCYSQITSSRPSLSDALTVQVVAGQVTPVDACMTVFNSAQLSGNPLTLSNPTDTRAQSILATFHRLHASWFYSKDFPVVSWPGHSGDMKDLYDSTTPALYYTRALFGPGVRASDPLTTQDFLQATRTTAAPTKGPESGHSQTDYVFTSSFNFAATGTLLGVTLAPTQPISYPALTTSVSTPAGQVAAYSSWGGGYLGTQAYISLNLSPLSSYTVYKTDGGVNMHRHFGKAVYKDTLCRELPVVRESDSVSFVDTKSSIPFRNSSACVKCHVSHDRVSGVIRGVYVKYLGTGDPTGAGTVARGGNFAQLHPVTQPVEGAWPTIPDSNYSSRPQNGQLYFRDYTGALVDQPVSGLSDLGTKISATDDYYICLAKRYYQYFTGIQVDTGDLADPAHGPGLGQADLNQRNIVIQLGKALKANQSLPQLVRSILSLDNYKKADFGVKGGGNGT